jgi:hypothetical protein
MAFLAPEDAIAERLTAKIDAASWGDDVAPRVYFARDADGAADVSHMAPALFVVFDGYAPTQQVADGAVQEVDQDWTVWAIARSASAHDTGRGVRDQAAAMVDVVLAALCGWKPSSDHRARFKTRITVHGDR